MKAEPIHLQLETMKASVEQVLTKITYWRLTDTSYRPNDEEFIPNKINSLPAKELREWVAYRAAGLSANDARKTLIQISKVLLQKRTHNNQQTFDSLASVRTNIKNRKSRLHAIRAERIKAMVPSTWCNHIQVQWVDDPNKTSLSYYQHVEWDRPYKYGRTNYPSIKHDVLLIKIAHGMPIHVSPDKKSITLGSAIYTKGRGHNLTITYT